MSRSAVSNAPPESFSAPQRPLRRLTLELFGIIALKIAVLMLIWWTVFAPQPKPDVSPAAIAQRLAPASHASTETRP
ncbi:hypothetical protein EAH88_04180 [Rhodanobacter glycinis]|uniref:Uncharacterized protein n=1 Tax=Rhodanobacter glycinis TaxID=582702 RepID=A0A502CFD4_9GAMM|nr:cytochrome oxidase putative small subunit CydP [Rhodanobacter glycinis]TPG11698.1 hypothetical protein EAH88_04180 [Rhodanobacter glycinis]